MKKSVAVISILAIFSLSAGCKNANRTLQKKFNFNTNYFLGLRALESGKTTEAEQNFLLCAKKGSGYCARYSEIEFIGMQNRRNRSALWQDFLQKYKDEEAILLASRDFFKSQEFAQVISLTDEINLKEAENELVSLRLKSMAEKNDSRYKNEVYTWFTERDISAEHYNFYRLNEELFSEEPNNQYEKNQNGSVQEKNNFSDSFSARAKTINFRISVYKKNYKNAFSDAAELLSDAKNNPLPLLLYSDIGKAFSYGSSDFADNAKKLDSAIGETSDSERLFYLNFYAGLLYDKSGKFPSKSEERLKNAINSTSDLKKQDNALWYLLRIKLKQSTDSGVNAVIENCKFWHAPHYFDDILDLISNLLLTEGKWNEFSKIYKAIDGYATDYMTSRFAYIAGRLLQENLATFEKSQNEKSVLIQEAFRRALNSGSDYYYRIMAINRLGLSEKEIQNQLCKTVLRKNETETDKEAEILLSGYAAFGFPEKIYPEFVKLSKKNTELSMDSMLSLSEFLKECGEKKGQFYPQSLRIASKAFREAHRNVSKEELELFFPKNYSSLVAKNCQTYKIPEEILFALVRSESFFDSKIKSSANAIGLTQLMEATASDVAKKLKVGEYNLLHPETNLEFGSFYLAELASRMDGKWLPALLAYNTGITRIRRWLNVQKKLPMDLFLEIAPYEETREYGRKLLSATCMYAWLYKNQSIENSLKLMLD